MSESVIEFPFTQLTRGIYHCNRPVIRLSVKTATVGQIELNFIFDTGSDFSMLPSSEAKNWGVKHPTDAQHQIRAMGIKGERVDGYLGVMDCRLAGVSFSLPTIFYYPHEPVDREAQSPDPSIGVSKSLDRAVPIIPSTRVRPKPLDPETLNDWTERMEAMRAAGASLDPIAGEFLLELAPGVAKKSLFDDPPFILGRAGFLPHFKVTLENNRTRVEKKKV